MSGGSLPCTRDIGSAAIQRRAEGHAVALASVKEFLTVQPLVLGCHLTLNAALRVAEQQLEGNGRGQRR